MVKKTSFNPFTIKLVGTRLLKFKHPVELCCHSGWVKYWCDIEVALNESVDIMHDTNYNNTADAITLTFHMVVKLHVALQTTCIY